ncbi:MAG TPA: hypothetical protein V6D19_08595, partial [Stenomitos sp.]
MRNCKGKHSRALLRETSGSRQVDSGVDGNGAALGKRVSRLRQRWRDRQWRRYAYVLLLGKGLSVLILLAVVFPVIGHLMGSPAMAADPVLKGNDLINPLNTVWTLVAAFLVFFMQVGFTMLEAGFCRSRETVNVLM